MKQITINGQKITRPELNKFLKETKSSKTYLVGWLKRMVEYYNNSLARCYCMKEKYNRNLFLYGKEESKSELIWLKKADNVFVFSFNLKKLQKAILEDEESFNKLIKFIKEK